MQKLQSQTFSYLSESVLKILSQNRIITILDFLQEDVTKLCSLTKLSLPEILAIRNEIFDKYAAPLIRGTDLLKKVLQTRKKINTGIERLNILTDGGISLGYITEICGLAESGKTQLSFQLAINCVMDTEDTVLYVDTKGDFSAVRIQKILDARGCSHKKMADVMYRIRVVHVWTMDELVKLFRSIKNKSVAIENLALIIVDSLPCLMFQYQGDENKISLSLLNTLVNYSRFISNEFHVGVIYVNIQTRWIDNDISEIEDEVASTSAFKESAYIERRNRCLGKYWEQVPSLVLVLEKLDENCNENSDKVQIKVSLNNSNNMYNLDEECVLHLSPNGIE